MKKIPSILLIGCLFILTACSALAPAAAAGSATAVQASPTPGIFVTDYTDAMPVASQLALGTLKLKGTADDLTPDEAASLLMLWKGMLAVSSATNPSTFEINGVLGQIQETMKPSQVQSIASMKLTNADIAKTTQELGVALGGNRAFGAGAGAAAGTGRTGTTTGNTGRNGGGAGGGGGGAQFFAGGGGGFGAIPGAGGPGGIAAGATPNSANVPASTQATVQARATQRALAGNTFLYNIVVSYLETLVPGSAPVRATPTPAQ